MKLAVIGCGHWGKNLARNFAEQNVLAAIVDPGIETATREFAGQDIPIRSLDDIMGDPNIEAVAIATPAVSHKDMALAAIAANKHVYIEKPLALTVTDGEQVKQAAEKAGKILMIGHLLQYHPVFVALRELNIAGELGNIRYAYSNRLSMGIFRTEEDTFWSLAPHDVSMLLALFDETPSEIRGSGLDFITKGVCDEARLDMVFSGGRHAHVFVSWLHPYKEQKLVIVGDKAMAVFDDTQPWENKLALYHHKVDMSGPVPKPVKADVSYVTVPQGEPLGSECKHFIDCCIGNLTPYTNADEALRVLRVLEQVKLPKA